MRPKPWFRVYHDALDDPKIQKLSADLFKQWFNLLCLGARHNGMLPGVDEIAFALRVSETEVETFLATFHQKELLDLDGGVFSIHGWAERQFQSDVSTERVNKFRDKHAKTMKRFRNVSETVDETDQSRPEQSRADKGQGSTFVDDPAPKVHILESKPTAEAIEVYNSAANDCGWPVCQKLTQSRKVKLLARVQDAGGMDGWRKAMDIARRSKFLRGEKRSNGHESWRPSIDFFLQQSSFTKLMEGAYGAEIDTATGPPPGVDPVEWYAKNVAKRA